MFEKANKAYSEKKYKTATELFEKVISSSNEKKIKLKSAETLTHIYELKGDFKNKRKILQYILINAEERNQRILAKQKMADMEFFKLKDYSTAITDYSELIQLNFNKQKNQLMVSKSYYYLNNFDQALYELEQILKENKNQELLFEAQLLKAHIKFAKKKYKSSSDIYKRLIENHPKPSKKNFVLLNLAMSYEEDGKYTEAIEALKKLQAYYHSPEFLMAKIHHIEKKKSLLPGGKGRLGR